MEKLEEFATAKLNGLDTHPPRSPSNEHKYSHLSHHTVEPASTPTHQGGVTFSSQHKLPKLPIPELESTCRKYIAALRPLQSAREHHETKAAVHEFLKSGGPELQERLKKYATGRSSYIEQFWYDSYLNFDNPVVLNLNPFFLLEDDPTPARNDQVTRASSLVISALNFVRAVRKEELAPDTLKSTPLCMHQYSRLFGTARIPTENGCVIGLDTTAKHIVVICRGQFYWFDVLDDNSDIIMTEKDLVLNLQVIVDDAQMTPIEEAAKGALGVLSTENRKVWARLRDILTREEGSNNADCLGIVDSALFIVCLDYSEPQSTADLCMNMLCGTSKVEKGVQIGTCTNRWYDKLQIIVCKNGSAGINFEHTGVDGHTVLRFASDVYTDTILRFAHSINGKSPRLWASTSPDPSKRDPESFGDVSTTPHKLEWDMHPELAFALRFAETRLADLIQQNEFATLDFQGYGKNFITSMGFSPDAFVQMAFQAAYYGLYGRVECTYEPAMTKVYFHGRTEAIRSVTDEAADFVRIFWGENPASQKVDSLRKACQKHVAITKESAKAQGMDRHLYALFCIWSRALDAAASEDFNLGDNNSSNDAASSNGRSTPMDDAASNASSERHRDASSPPPGRSSFGSSSSSGRRRPHRESIASSSSPSRGQHSRQGSTAGGSPTAHQMPAIFSDGGWDKLNMTILSTSNCGNPSLRQFGFGPTSGEGFGIGYIIKDDSISICASSKHRQTSRFVDAIESYLIEMRKLLRQTAPQKVSTRASRVREVEERPKLAKHKSRGRLIGGQSIPPSDTESRVDSDEEGLGGYGFFDAGMLLQALKSKQDERPSAKAVGHARRAIGKKLHLNDI
ncbi:carnitine acetyl transferase [Xylona heveae TC161]|uniref:Carnitine acetyl transferase n=1 Tax=Xylona heveae (strain CBS 132557 / TC161) TaxID=1328760 RepID=A0A165AKK8_XYLHT|nr:carnitine acetyl transferase [Xylona heveae TC161]KZF20638.1 carnitine acetyl transferase [Xylona heveae TC161]